MGTLVYPSSNTCDYYDDKIAEMLLLQAIDAPVIRSKVWFDEKSALRWVDECSYPTVMKLRKGAGSHNVWIVGTKEQATSLVRKAFHEGFNPIPSYWHDHSTKIRKIKTLKSLALKIMRMPRTLASIHENQIKQSMESGYAFFQEFLAGNSFDIRITVIGRRAFGFRRFNRPNDYRASGSGIIDYTPDRIPMECITSSFSVARRLGAQSLAIDFLLNQKANRYEICEISYSFVADAIYQCPGFWYDDFEWRAGRYHPQELILDDVLSEVQKREL